ncbi:MAG: 50S ribosomal protein L17 [Treponema sp.]
MKHRNGFNPLSRTTSHRRALHRNMVTSLFRYERITTTKQKAMEVRRTAEKLITSAKSDTFNNRRKVARYIYDEEVLDRLFTKIGPRMKDRNGGYTRVLKIGTRVGDTADVAILELVDFSIENDKLNRKKRKNIEVADSNKKEVSEKVSHVKHNKDVSKPSKQETEAQDGQQVRRFNRVKGS